MATVRIVTLPGDGVGPEVVEGALRVLQSACARFGHSLYVKEYPVGYAATLEHGTPLPESTLEACTGSPAVLLGAVGDPRAAELPPELRPEKALLTLRAALSCFANLRPAKVDPSLRDGSALRPEVVEGTDLVIVRELNGGLYYGTPRTLDMESGVATNTLAYTREEIARVARVAFELARGRRGRVTSVDKANVLEVSRLWRAVVDTAATEYPEVEVEHMLVDRAAMELVLRPSRFDVILTENMFGDILSDEVAAIGGSLGVLGSASIGGATGLYEPVHGSAPDIAGRGIANPIGAIRSAALMLEHSFGLVDEARVLDAAVSSVLAAGLRTADLVRDRGTPVGTLDFADAVARVVENAARPRRPQAQEAAS